MSNNCPPAKRRREATRVNSVVVILAPGESAELAQGRRLETFSRDVDFWLDDGNLILLAGNTAFRVYKCLLKKNSAVFADMFATGSRDATETFDGCPVARLSDHPEDLRDFLQYLMPCYKLTLRKGLPVSDFSQLYAAVHLGHNYQCPDVETRALSVLKNFYTPRFICHRQSSSYTSEGFAARPPKSAAIAAVNIARLTKTPSMLPFALYEVCTLDERVLDGYKRRNGSVEHLSPADLRLCLGSACRELVKQMAFYVQDILRNIPCEACESGPQCTVALNILREDVQVEVWGSCHIFDKKIVTAHIKPSSSLCTECREWVTEQEDIETRKAWEMLPGAFGMKNQECGFTILKKGN